MLIENYAQWKNSIRQRRQLINKVRILKLEAASLEGMINSINEDLERYETNCVNEPLCCKGSISGCQPDGRSSISP